MYFYTPLPANWYWTRCRWIHTRWFQIWPLANDASAQSGWSVTDRCLTIKPRPFLSAPLSSWLGFCFRAVVVPELTPYLNAISERALSFSSPRPAMPDTFPLQPRPRSHPLCSLCASQSTLYSFLLTLTSFWESYTLLEPAIKSS